MRHICRKALEWFEACGVAGAGVDELGDGTPTTQMVRRLVEAKWLDQVQQMKPGDVIRYRLSYSGAIALRRVRQGSHKPKRGK